MSEDFHFLHLDFGDGLETFRKGMAHLRNEVLQPAEFLDPEQWLTENVELQRNDSFRSGGMKLFGFQRPVSAAAMDPMTDQITVLKGVQVGWSSFIKALLLYGVSYLALSMIVAQPTDDDAKGYYKDHIEPRFNDVEALRDIRRKPSRGEVQDTWDEHRFTNGARLYMRGAASDDSFRRISAQWLFGDEVDAEAWLQKTEKAQGDKLELFRARGTAFANRILWVGSTPTRRDVSIVWREWLKSSRERLHVACPHCGERQHLKWGSSDTSYGFRRTLDEYDTVTDCWYVCEARGCRIDEHHKEEMVENGIYISDPDARPNRPGHRGFHWPQWYSIAPQANWKSLMQQWVNAQGDADALQVFVNNVMGEPWDDVSGEEHDALSMMSQRTPYPAEVPDDVVVIAIGVDQQDNKEGSKMGTAEEISSLEVSVIGFNSKKQVRVIRHDVILGEFGDARAEAELDAIRRRGYLRRDGSRMTPQATCIDMGSSKIGRGDAVKAYAAARIKENVWAIKGDNKSLTKATSSSKTSVWPKRVSRNRKLGWQWYMIDTQQAKFFLSRRLAMRGPGGPMFPMHFDEDYFEGLAAEGVKTDRKGISYWKRRGANTGEPWDCMVYAYAALCGLQTFPRWRSLDVAAKTAGIPDIAHDPETGELDYAGPDRSVLAGTSDPAEDDAKKAGSMETQPPVVAKKRKKSTQMQVIRRRR